MCVHDIVSIRIDPSRAEKNPATMAIYLTDVAIYLTDVDGNVTELTAFAFDKEIAYIPFSFGEE